MPANLVESFSWFLLSWFRTCWLPALGLAVVCILARPLMLRLFDPVVRKWTAVTILLLALIPWIVLSALPGSFESSDILDHEISAITQNPADNLMLVFVQVGALLAFLGMIPGLGVLIGRALVSWHMVQGSKSPSPRVRKIFTDQCRLLGMANVRLLENSACPGPATWGWKKPVVLYPEDLAGRLGDQDLALVFRHELAHIRGDDLLVSVGIDAIAGIFWFLPLVWVLSRYWRADTEYGADAVAASMVSDGGDPVSVYGRTLLSVLDWQSGRAPLSGASAMAGPAREMKNRLMILARESGKNRFAQKKMLPPFVGPFTRLRQRITRLVAVLAIVLVFSCNIWSCITYAPGMGFSRQPSMTRNQMYRMAANSNAVMDWTQAAICYARILQEYPGDEEASLVLSRILIQKNRHDQALAVLGKIARESPSSHVLRGRIMDFEDHREDACREYSAALEFPAPHEANHTFAIAGLESPMKTPKRPVVALDGLEELKDRSGWTVEMEGSGSVGAPELAIDRQIRTRWESDRSMSPGMAFTLDLGSWIPLGAVVYIDDASGGTIWTDDYPRSWSIEVWTSDGQWYEIGGGDGRADEYASASGGGVECRKIRINQFGRTNGEHWSIYDIKVYRYKETAK